MLEAAAKFLAVRPRSVDETRRRLVRNGYPTELVDQVLAQLIELEYLDDAAFAAAWVESRDRARPRGALALRRELATNGVPRETVDEVVRSRDTAADVYGAKALLERRRASLEREPDPGRRRQKAYELLARNGFEQETCREVSKTFVAS